MLRQSGRVCNPNAPVPDSCLVPRRQRLRVRGPARPCSGRADAGGRQGDPAAGERRVQPLPGVGVDADAAAAGRRAPRRPPGPAGGRSASRCRSARRWRRRGGAGSSRVMSRRSASAPNSRSSRLPDPYSIITLVPSAISVSPTVTGAVVCRARPCTDDSSRRNSTSAAGISSGSATRRSRWAWSPSRSMTPWEMRLPVVSLPPATMTKQNPRMSQSLSRCAVDLGGDEGAEQVVGRMRRAGAAITSVK